LLNVWLSQTYGVAFATAATLTPFAWIESGLRLVDQPGAQSLFERELSFASKVLRRSNLSERGLLLYDELFHSTNPPDGTKTAKRFLDSLWTSNSVLSVVSTHVFELVEASPKHVQRLCVPASLSDTGIRFSFTLVPGICKVSSVEQLYKKFGFPASPKDNPKDNPKESP
jgi:DNA mismatch repair ATPase MutS